MRCCPDFCSKNARPSTVASRTPLVVVVGVVVVRFSRLRTRASDVDPEDARLFPS